MELNKIMELKINYYVLSFITIFGLAIISDGCSKLKENITQPQALTIHKMGFNDTSSVNFHGKFLAANNFDLASCQKCHAADFKGGITGVSCYNCHTQAAGPLACNTCHGNFNDPSRIAPPRDVDGNSSTDLITVGAHDSHLYNNDFSVVACENCHKVPNAENVMDHFSHGPQSNIVKLDSLAIHGIAANAKFDTSTGTCANVYCHGNFEFNKSDAPPERKFAYTSDKMTGNVRTVKWTILDGSQAPCGSCHGTPDGFISPVGHIKLPITECVACHSTVVNEKGEIIDKTKHINGQINYALNKKR
jgi:predicted CxxxxCH...CXXCH cytochrome family protein